MRGVQWSPATGLRCEDCGGYEIDLLSDGTARCRSCGRVSVPRSPRRFAGIARLAFALIGAILAALGVEAALSMAVAGGNGAEFVGTFSTLAFFTGLAAVVIAGIGAAPGRIALGTQRMDRLSRMYPVQDPAMIGSLDPQAQGRSTREPDAAGLFVLAGLGFVLMAAGYFLRIL
jgi:hypothetical protein